MPRRNRQPARTASANRRRPPGRPPPARINTAGADKAAGYGTRVTEVAELSRVVDVDPRRSGPRGPGGGDDGVVAVGEVGLPPFGLEVVTLGQKRLRLLIAVGDEPAQERGVSVDRGRQVQPAGKRFAHLDPGHVDGLE